MLIMSLCVVYINVIGHLLSVMFIPAVYPMLAVSEVLAGRLSFPCKCV